MSLPSEIRFLLVDMIMSIYRQHVTFVGSCHVYYVERILYVSHQQNHFYRVSLFSPSGPTTIVHNSRQYLVLMQLISKIISHKAGPLSFLILLK